jgi:CRISPR/Cas system CMR-associated protein Cmr5 small subunit
MNLEQKRARHALDKADEARQQGQEGNCLSGYPSLIINNGLLATLAFSLHKGNQHGRVANAVAYHLHQMGIVPQPAPGPHATALRNALVADQATSHLLRRATAEALAFLAYLKRFAT